MAREIPEVVRAAAGLAATVLDEARKLPEALPGLPVRIIGVAMQHAMKLQQQYAGLVARGDELFTGLRGENEPGMATFDDEEEEPAPSPGFRGSAFDRTADTMPAGVEDVPITDDEVAELPDDPAADVIVAAVEDLAEEVEGAEESIEVLVVEAPSAEEVLDELAIDELVDQAASVDETAPGAPADVPATEDAVALEVALLESTDTPAAADTVDTLDAEPPVDVATTVDVLTPAGEVATVEAAVTDEGIAAPETPEDTAAPETPEDTAEEDAATAEGAAGDAIGEESAAPTDDAGTGGELAGSQDAGTVPVEGYDGFSIAQLRGRLRGYTLSTVQDLLAYEEATRAREPYLRMLRNRLEKLEAQAVESSPLSPRGA
jgi:hypothetical protein